MVNAELFLPTPFVSTRKFRFIRCLKEIIPNIWILFDISTDYFNNITSDSTFKPDCRRRPSGVIIRKHKEHSEVIWIENVEVNDGMADGSDMAFCAKRWVNALLQKVKRQDSEVISINTEIGWKVSNSLLKVTEIMEKVYSECVNGTPNENKWTLLSDRGVRILRSRIGNHSSAMGSNNYIGLTSFRVPKKPSSVLDLLARKNMALQWPSFLSLVEPEEVIKLAVKDGGGYITIHKKAYEYVVQVVSRDEFCSFILSSPMIQDDVDLTLLYGSLRENILKPSGFTVIPGGPPESDSSLVTIAMQQELEVSGTEEAIEAVSQLINSTVNEINEAVARDGEENE
ncbi:homeobox-leucine zipper protein ROC7-like [Carica papaya]|uniref:homeobox-leucine zipper protein ROC7-like n=1 Tax=Carica papaya TaxID=3649 RepID=UPI000B8CC822|nr:homeobox-leucine zipper protein ROC7-like [Carica papaya]